MTSTVLKPLPNALSMSACLLICGVLSACGFHLRGSGGTYQLPAIDWRQPLDSTFLKQVHRQLLSSNVKFSSQGVGLEITPIKTEHNAIAFSSTGNVLEYALTVEATVTLDLKHEKRPKEHSVSASQSYQFVSNNALGSNRQEREVRRSLERELAGKILNLLSAYRIE